MSDAVSVPRQRLPCGSGVGTEYSPSVKEGRQNSYFRSGELSLGPGEWEEREGPMLGPGGRAGWPGGGRRLST